MQSPINPVRCEELIRLRHKIRRGEEPDNPSLICRWLALENNEQGDDIVLDGWRHRYEDQFTLLLETFVDELVPAHWRCVCLDNIYRPLLALQQISDSTQSNQQIQRLLRELAIQSHYVRHSLCF